MAKCECCGEREADRKIDMPKRGYEDCYGVSYSWICANEPGMCDRIRARRAAQAEHHIDRLLDGRLMQNPPPPGYGATVRPTLADALSAARAQREPVADGEPYTYRVGHYARPRGWAALPIIVHPPEPTTCRDCTSPATVNGRCVYCEHSTAGGRREGVPHFTDRAGGDWAVSMKMKFHDKNLAQPAAPKPRVTASSRELAKPHPWECDE